MRLRLTSSVLLLAIVTAGCALFGRRSPAREIAARPLFSFGETIRVDYLHSGGPRGERFALAGVVREGSWAGNRSQLIDGTGLGNHLFEVIDRRNGEVIFSRAFASIYAEWETTPEFRKSNRTFHESLRFPRPMIPVRVVLKKRDRQQEYQEVWTLDVNGAGTRAFRADMPGQLVPLGENTEPEHKVDLVLVSDGYTAAEMAKFRSDAARLTGALFALEPFKSRRGDFNVWMLEVPGKPLNVEFNVFGIERYALTYDNRTFRNLLANVPYDVVEILANDARYGGGGIFNLQSTVAAGGPQSEYVFVHEFAHNLAGLGDEYTGSVTYETGAAVKVEPWEPNLTALHDPATLKWKDLVEPGTPIPTPSGLTGKVGAFEGGGYESRGIYRPEAQCIMGSRMYEAFCRVCQRAINRVIDFHTGL